MSSWSVLLTFFSSPDASPIVLNCSFTFSSFCLGLIVPTVSNWFLEDVWPGTCLTIQSTTRWTYERAGFEINTSPEWWMVSASENVGLGLCALRCTSKGNSNNIIKFVSMKIIASRKMVSKYLLLFLEYYQMIFFFFWVAIVTMK